MGKRVFKFLVDEDGVRRFTEVDQDGVPVPKRAPTPTTPSAARVNDRPPAAHPHMALWAACLERGGPTLDDADEIAKEIGVTSATALVRECGSHAPMAALAARLYGRAARNPA